MSNLFESEIFTARLDDGGFLEFIVHESRELSWGDLFEMRDFAFEHKLDNLRVLINRLHDYSTDASLLLPPYPKLPLTIVRVAYLVYTATAERIARYVGDTALPYCPHAVFHDRGQAVSWLLADVGAEREA